VRYCVDTDVLIEELRGRQDIRDKLAATSGELTR
jgi:hypothetical protein